MGVKGLAGVLASTAAPGSTPGTSIRIFVQLERERRMANNLDMDLTDKVVVLDAQYLKPEYHSLRSRLFKVSGGFGALPFTAGRALMGEFLCDGERCRMEGFMVERLATDEDMAAVGWTVGEDT
jgi:hypothetical protein